MLVEHLCPTDEI